jgi:hypothetical protein
MTFFLRQANTIDERLHVECLVDGCEDVSLQFASFLAVLGSFLTDSAKRDDGQLQGCDLLAPVFPKRINEGSLDIERIGGALLFAVPEVEDEALGFGARTDKESAEESEHMTVISRKVLASVRLALFLAPASTLHFLFGVRLFQIWRILQNL